MYNRGTEREKIDVLLVCHIQNVVSNKGRPTDPSALIGGLRGRGRKG